MTDEGVLRGDNFGNEFLVLTEFSTRLWTF